jgi:hypothetical protein
MACSQIRSEQNEILPSRRNLIRCKQKSPERNLCKFMSPASANHHSETHVGPQLPQLVHFSLTVTNLQDSAQDTICGKLPHKLAQAQTRVLNDWKIYSLPRACSWAVLFMHVGCNATNGKFRIRRPQRIRSCNTGLPSASGLIRYRL